MLSRELEISFNSAFKYAREHRHEFVTIEHMLLSLLDSPSTIPILTGCGANIEVLRGELIDYLDDHTPLLDDEDENDTQPTLGFQRVIQRAVIQVQSSEQKEVTGANILVAIFNEKESQALYILQQQDVNRLDVVNYISHGSLDDGMESGSAASDEAEAERENPLTQFATNLNNLAIEGRIDPLIGRRSEIERTVLVLCRLRKNYPLLVGVAGVG